MGVIYNMNELNQLALEKISSNLLNYGDLNIAIDVSNNVNINLIKHIVKKIVDEFKKETNIIFSDSKVIKSLKYEEFNTTLFELGKGIADFSQTLDFINDEINKNGCSGLIYITQGYGFFPKIEPDYPVTWILIGNNPNEDTPFGLNIKIS